MVVLKIIQNFLPNGTPLDQWVKAPGNLTNLRDKNYLYIIQKRQDQGKFTKFGISEYNPKSRLLDYIAYHGNVSTTYPFQGVMLFAILGTKSDDTGYVTHTTQVRQMEDMIKDRFKRDVFRGTELVRTKPIDIYNFILDRGVVHPAKKPVAMSIPRKNRSRVAPERYTGGGLYLGKTPRTLAHKMMEERAIRNTGKYPSDFESDGGAWYYWYSE
jgi:hypothetical protein